MPIWKRWPLKDCSIPSWRPSHRCRWRKGIRPSKGLMGDYRASGTASNWLLHRRKVFQHRRRRRWLSTSSMMSEKHRETFTVRLRSCSRKCPTSSKLLKVSNHGQASLIWGKKLNMVFFPIFSFRNSPYLAFFYPFFLVFGFIAVSE